MPLSLTSYSEQERSKGKARRHRHAPCHTLGEGTTQGRHCLSITPGDRDDGPEWAWPLQWGEIGIYNPLNKDAGSLTLLASLGTGGSWLSLGSLALSCVATAMPTPHTMDTGLDHAPRKRWTLARLPALLQPPTLLL